MAQQPAMRGEKIYEGDLDLLKVTGWVNAKQMWTVGTGNLASAKIHVEAFMQ